MVATFGGALALTLATYRAGDPSLNASASGQPANALGAVGADVADLAIQTLGVGAWAIALVLIVVGVSRLAKGARRQSRLTGVCECSPAHWASSP